MIALYACVSYDFLCKDWIPNRSKTILSKNSDKQFDRELTVKNSRLKSQSHEKLIKSILQDESNANKVQIKCSVMCKCFLNLMAH